MTEIPVVVASDERYLPPTYVTLYSMLRNAGQETFYAVYLLCPCRAAQAARQFLGQLEKEFSNCRVTILDMGEKFSDVKMKIAHISSPTFFRLCLPGELSELEKCIYLDSDIIVNGDLTELYETDMTNAYLAGVLSEGIQTNRVYQRELCRRIGLPDVKSYINAGVLVLNLELLRRDCIMEKWLALVGGDFPAQDQDILNLVCHGRIRLLPLKYNAMTKCCAIRCSENEISAQVYSREEIDEARHAPVIIHYADRIKPWADSNSLFADLWWNAANSIGQPEVRSAVIDFARSAVVPRDTLGQKGKRKLLYVLQLAGLYAPLKKIEDKLKHR